MRLLGVDFTSRPTPRKPIVMAWAHHKGKGVVVLERLVRAQSLEAFEAELNRHEAFVGGFDLPFGLPRELVIDLGWPTDWFECMQTFFSHSRAELRELFMAFCAKRAVGSKFAHRGTDLSALSSPSMKWVNPPVAYMMHAGVPALLSAGLTLVGLHPGDPKRLGLEAYPGLLAREIVGSRSYKSDDRAKQTDERLIARKDILHALELGLTRLGLRLKLSDAQRDELIKEPQGDTLDAVLCAVQAAWGHGAHLAGDPHFGLPAQFDPLEGWIVSATAL
jgi:Protein of unknown function (DUF429)